MSVEIMKRSDLYSSPLLAIYADEQNDIDIDCNVYYLLHYSIMPVPRPQGVRSGQV